MAGLSTGLEGSLPEERGLGRRAPSARATTLLGRARAAAGAMTGRRGRRLRVGLLLAIVIAGGGLRVQTAATNHRPITGDALGYINLGNTLIRHHWGNRGDPGVFHWAPGAPFAFAAVALLTGQRTVTGHTFLGGPQGGLNAGREAQILISTLTIVAVWGLALVLAGWAAALVAAAVIAFYPPAIHEAASYLSEPLGALLLVAGILALSLAVRRDERIGSTASTRAQRVRTLAAYAGAGAVLALSCLARADMLIVALLLPLVVLVGRRRLGWLPAATRAAAMLVATLLVLAPWTIYASSRQGAFVPITNGTQDTLFIATYLPGNGELHYVFEALRPEVCRRYPHNCGTPATAPPSGEVFDIVAARYPHLSRAAAISKAAKDNLRKYLLGQPLQYGVMLAKHLWRLWGGYFRGSLGYALNQWTLWLHRVVVLLSVIGLFWGLWRSRSLALASATVALLLLTAVNTFYVAEARDNERMIPLLIAAGTAGWWLAARRGRRANAREGARAAPALTMAQKSPASLPGSPI